MSTIPFCEIDNKKHVILAALAFPDEPNAATTTQSEISGSVATWTPVSASFSEFKLGHDQTSSNIDSHPNSP